MLIYIYIYIIYIYIYINNIYLAVSELVWPTYAPVRCRGQWLTTL